jgi:membrane-bound serine protease (ClpP class)
MWMVLTLVLVGAALLLLETILPGLIAGIAGMCCLAGAVIIGYTSFGVGTGNLILLGIGLGLLAGTSVWLKYFPGSRMARIFISHAVVGDLDVDKPELLHQTGVALTNLRPSGTAVINGHRVDVVTEGPMIERGAPVRVVAVEGMRVVVRAVENRSAAPAERADI